MLNAYPHRATHPEVQEHLIRIEGAGTSAPVKSPEKLGAGVTVTRTSEGVIKFAWDDNPGVFLGATATLQAKTPADVANHTVVFDEYDGDDLELELRLYELTESTGDVVGALEDLAADEFITVRVLFSTSAVGGA